MSRLANCNITSKVVRALRRAGFREEQGGKHTIMRHPVSGCYTTIPRQPRLNVMTLKSIVKQCGLSEEQFVEFY